MNFDFFSLGLKSPDQLPIKEVDLGLLLKCIYEVERRDLTDDDPIGYLIYLNQNIPAVTATERQFREYALAWCWKGGLPSWGLENRKKYRYSLWLSYNAFAVRVTDLYYNYRKNANSPQ